MDKSNEKFKQARVVFKPGKSRPKAAFLKHLALINISH